MKGKILLADRAYVGHDWLRFLADIGVDFVVGLPMWWDCQCGGIANVVGLPMWWDCQCGGIANVVGLPIKCYKKQVKNYGSLQQKARRGKRAVSTPIEWEGYCFQLVMKKNPAACPHEPILYWITSLPDAIMAGEWYGKRWKIEICFKCFKTNGFNLQQMNFKSPVKISLLIAIIVFANVLCLPEGFREGDQMATKRYRSGAIGSAQSFFKRGLHEISARLLNFGPFFRQVKAWFDSRPKVKWRFVQ